MAMQPVQIPTSWTPPYELTRALPRDLKLTGVGIFVMLLAVLFFVLGVLAFVFIAKASQRGKLRKEELRRDGIDSKASIARVWKSGKSSVPMMEYQFSAGGRQFTESVNVPKELWDGLKVGAPIAVRFLPRDPTVSHPAGWENEPAPFWLSLVLFAVFAGTGCILLWARLPEVRLLRDGLPAPGVVIKVSESESGYYVNYAFRQQDGTISNGRDTSTRRPEVGETITVLYNPLRPGRNRMYPGRSYGVNTR